jgi:transcriptional regulator with XRE-family HTH domain
LVLSNLAEHIKLLMRENGITSVNDLSRRTGITLSALQAVVNGISRPRPTTLRTLGHFFGVSPKDLVSDLSGANTGPVAFQSVSEVLKYLIEDVCVSERELSRLTGVQHKIINNIVLGHTNNPTDASLLPIAKFFSVTLKQLRAEEPLDRHRPKGENNEHLLQNNRIPLIPWNRLPLLPEALTDDSHDQVATKFFEPKLYATRVEQLHSMEPIIRSGDLLIVNYSSSFSIGEMFLVQFKGYDVTIGNYSKNGDKESLHFSDPTQLTMPLLQGQYRKLGLVQEIRRDG